MILNAVSTNLEMSNATEDLIFKCHKEVPQNEWSDRHFPTLWYVQMHFGSKQGTLLKATLFFQEAKPSAFESLWLYSECFAIYAFKNRF